MLDTLRSILWFSLAVILVGLWYVWSQDYPQLAPEKQQPAVQSSHPSQPATATQVAAKWPAIPRERQITFKTDVFQGAIDKAGGHLIYLALLKYKDAPETGSNKSGHPFVLLDHTSDYYATAQTDLLKPSESALNHEQRLYQSEKTHYTLDTNQKDLSINLHAQENGVDITKQFTFQQSKYQVDVHYRIHNNSQHTWQVTPYAQLTKQPRPKTNQWFVPAAYSGGVVSSDDKPYEKVSFDAMGTQRLPKNTKQAWLSLVQPYFATAWISQLPAATYYSSNVNTLCILGLLGPTWKVAPGAIMEGNLSLYTGPKTIKPLQKSAKHLELLVDYGILWPVATTLLWLLVKCHSWIGNWGWAIICLSLLIKLAFLHSSITELRNSLKQRRLQPQLNEIKARYAQDPQKQLHAQMELYRRHKINPLSIFTFLLSIIQLVISMALYWILIDSIELRYQPFMFWIKDLSTKDPYYILPLLLGSIAFIDTFIHQKLNAPNSRFMQNNDSLLIMILPIIFTGVAINFPSGLSLYWLVHYIFASLQKGWLLSTSQAMPRRSLT
jgi:YidC/Oxa1 family membrane protein insertase